MLFAIMGKIGTGPGIKKRGGKGRNLKCQGTSLQAVTSAAQRKKIQRGEDANRIKPNIL